MNSATGTNLAQSQYRHQDPVQSITYYGYRYIHVLMNSISCPLSTTKPSSTHCFKLLHTMHQDSHEVFMNLTSDSKAGNAGGFLEGIVSCLC